MSPEKMVEQAEEIAKQLMDLPAVVKDHELAVLKKSNPSLHALVQTLLQRDAGSIPTGEQTWPWSDPCEPVSVFFTVGPVKEWNRPGLVGRQHHHRPVKDVLMSFIITDSQALHFAPTFKDKKQQPTTPKTPPTWSVSDSTIINVVPSADGLTADVVAVGPLTPPGTSVQVQVQTGAITGTADIQVIAGDVASVDMGAGAPTEQPDAVLQKRLKP